MRRPWGGGVRGTSEEQRVGAVAWEEWRERKWEGTRSWRGRRVANQRRSSGLEVILRWNAIKEFCREEQKQRDQARRQ